MEKRQLNPRILTIWRQRAIMTHLIVWLIIGGFVTSIFFFDWPHFLFYIAGALAALNILQLILYVFVFPSINYRTFFYAIRQEDLLIQDGIFIITQTVIPFTRVQNVETEQGPLLRKHHLTAVSVTTAAGEHEIPALEESDALALRDQIAELIKENPANEI
ncbi:MAG: PH domain-containing protein [Sporolactobacillus sp.]|uniref:PH domain-containing protein n=1 Tax=Sporolactobacillus sp. STSJ-5 TaxID=2965076 RepID=UPI002102187A|nr:PH domain-containing protein [Sporolactobacillus sp. STSJ-5]MCQ2009860.1 PH domain-containing protein [Sporolactobacillus sp. STSJ-5]